MLQNAYFLAKIGADTAENEQHFAEILPIGRRVADRRVKSATPGRSATAGPSIPVSQYLPAEAQYSSFPPNFERLVLCCIEADFCK